MFFIVSIKLREFSNDKTQEEGDSNFTLTVSVVKSFSELFLAVLPVDFDYKFCKISIYYIGVNHG